MYQYPAVPFSGAVHAGPHAGFSKGAVVNGDRGRRDCGYRTASRGYYLSHLVEGEQKCFVGSPRQLQRCLILSLTDSHS